MSYAQAGFWLFLVAQVAIPLAVLLGVTRLVLDHRHRTRWSSLPPPPSQPSATGPPSN